MIEAGADAVIIGEARYGMRLPGEVKLDEMRKLCPGRMSSKAKVYVAVNNIFDNNALEGL